MPTARKQQATIPPTPPTSRIPTWTLGDRLRKARREAGLEAQDLAEDLGVSRNTVSNAENDRGPTPKRHLVWAWAMATGVDRHWLESGNEPSEEGGIPEGRVSRRAGGGTARLSRNSRWSCATDTPASVTPLRVSPHVSGTCNNGGAAERHRNSRAV